MTRARETELATMVGSPRDKRRATNTEADRPAMPSARERSDAAACELGDKIRALRQSLQRTLEETALAADISKPFLSQVERGLASPSLKSLAGIAKALGVSMQYFVDTPLDEGAVRREGAGILSLWQLRPPVRTAHVSIWRQAARCDPCVHTDGENTYGTANSRGRTVFVRDRGRTTAGS